MNTALTREAALEALKKYNKEPFHILHALTVEGVMRWFAQDQGYGEEADFWGIAGLLHDIDFEMYPEQHCVKAPELLREAGAEDGLIHAVCRLGRQPGCAHQRASWTWRCPALRKNSRINALQPDAPGT